MQTAPSADKPAPPPALPPPRCCATNLALSPAVPPGLPPPHRTAARAEVPLCDTPADFGCNWMLPGCPGPGSNLPDDDPPFIAETLCEDGLKKILKPKLSITTGASQHWLSFSTVSQSTLLPPPYTPTPSPAATRSGFTALHRSKSVPNISDTPVDKATTTAVYVSHNRVIAHRKEINLPPKIPENVDPPPTQDAFGDWEPVTQALDENVELGMEEPADNTSTSKRKKYPNADEPQNFWRGRMDDFLQLMFLTDSSSASACSTCLAPAENGRLWRCGDCGLVEECRQCSLKRHQLFPLHRVQVWRDSFWTDVSLDSMHYVFQLGHGGSSCPSPSPSHTMVILHTNGIHNVSIRYCTCSRHVNLSQVEQLLLNQWYPATTITPSTCATFESLESFRLLNVAGNVTSSDFVRVLELKTDSTGLAYIYDRNKAFARMARQFAFLKRMKRAGRGHAATLLCGTLHGQCAVPCWACPHSDRNLPRGWEDVPVDEKYLYMLILAMDANFRLKNRIRANEVSDQPLGSGWGYFVEDQGYRTHLASYVTETDTSTCIAFQALLQKETRVTTGHRCSGVGGVICARHECVRPNGIGDLQKGERYANMDFILFSSILGIALHLLCVSYDIACQWKINLAKRRDKLPTDLQASNVTIHTALPIWHSVAHEQSCQMENSLQYQRGVGCTDGEGIERVWSLLNPASWSTRVMGAGARQDNLEDRIDFHNWQKNIKLADTLSRKLSVAQTELASQTAAFEEVSQPLDPSIREDWENSVNTWDESHTGTNPYWSGRTDGPTVAQVRLSLKKEEDEETRRMGSPVRTITATSFLVAGLQLEEAQLRIRSQIASGGTELTLGAENKIVDRRRQVMAKLEKFRDMQVTFMPCARDLIAEEEAQRDPNATPASAEYVKLWLPSELTHSAQQAGCVTGLVEKEIQLRRAEAYEVLDGLRRRLHARQYLIAYRNANAAGQNQSTRARTIITHATDRINFLASKYRRTRAALINLSATNIDEFKELSDSDIALPTISASDTTALQKLTRIGTNHTRGVTFSRKDKISWIWTVCGARDDSEEDLHLCIREEWARARARKRRWQEEVSLLKEEMRRVLRFLDWSSKSWTQQADALPAATELINPALRQRVRRGLRSYALKQVSLQKQTAEAYRSHWTKVTPPSATTTMPLEVPVTAGLPPPPSTSRSINNAGAATTTTGIGSADIE
ncbi:hypothetical protein ONZ45_g16285 [Pleurotus djamor]|nr:hypothetical protein ONZ45_g16285 [Pleurotus djamor]